MQHYRTFTHTRRTSRLTRSLPKEKGIIKEATPVLASRWQRLGGALFDTLLGLAIALPVMSFAGVFRQISRGQPFTLGQHAFFFCFGQVAFLLVNGYLLAKHGQTVGKRFVGTRIVSDRKGRLLPLGHVFCLRYLPLSIIAMIPFIGPLFCFIDIFFIFREDKRCIHDLFAGTKVIDIQASLRRSRIKRQELSSRPSPRGLPADARREGMMTLHPNILERDGKKTFAVLPYEEFQKVQEALDDYEKLKGLRAAETKEVSPPGTQPDPDPLPQNRLPVRIDPEEHVASAGDGAADPAAPDEGGAGGAEA
jgi:uncharacterized RDD family membrane protein YckC